MVARRLRGKQAWFFWGLIFTCFPRAVSFSDHSDSIINVNSGDSIHKIGFVDAPSVPPLIALNATEAARTAQHAAEVANQIATHSVRAVVLTQATLQNAQDALQDARADSHGLSKKQQNILHKAENELHTATQRAEYGRLEHAKYMKTDVTGEKSLQAWGNNGGGELEALWKELVVLRKKLKVTDLDAEAVRELKDIEGDLQASKGTNENLDALKVKFERLWGTINKMRGRPHTNAIQEPDMEIDTEMPHGGLQPFGREDTAQELTAASIRESNKMVDQLERAEVAEEKRAVFRALTRLRGAAIASYDGVARAQTTNMDDYNRAHTWRASHPLQHLATEESDVSKWAFPSTPDTGGEEPNDNTEAQSVKTNF